MAVLASWSMATLAGLHSAASLAYAGSVAPAPLSIEAQLRQLPQQHQPAMMAKKMLVAPAGKSANVASLSATRSKPKAVAAVRLPADPFSKIVADAKLSRKKFLAAFASAGMAIEETNAAELVDPFGKITADAKLSRKKFLAAFASAGMTIADTEASETADETVEMALAMPIAERFHRAVEEAASSALAAEAAKPDPFSSLALGQTGLKTGLAYAAADQSPDNPVELALASLSDDPYGMDSDEPQLDDEPQVDEAMPDSVDLPPAKPDIKPSKADAKPAQEPADEPAAPARKPAKADKAEPQQTLAYAKPDKPGVAGAFKNLFNTPKAGNGVAIYDISASVVHMPDGTRLEAHSGIGNMADNPRFVHVKMNGPTPPNVYKLSMREKRFHGVEAIRMTPVGGGKMHGRTGILAHSYLLRGGRAESHGCVAFKDYARFLKAFKQGKVKQIIVVPSLSRAQKVRVASNARGA